jgi:hypothetical protein
MKPSQIIFNTNIIIDEIRNNCKTHPFEQPSRLPEAIAVTTITKAVHTIRTEIEQSAGTDNSSPAIYQ